jgi:hypothetical protein
MLLATVLFVSKRLQRIVAALICLAAVQLAVAVAQKPDMPPGAVRVSLSAP